MTKDALSARRRGGDKYNGTTAENQRFKEDAQQEGNKNVSYRLGVGVILVSVIFVILQFSYLKATPHIEVTSVIGEGFFALILVGGIFVIQRLQHDREIYTRLMLGISVLYFYSVTDILDEFLEQPKYITYIFEDLFQICGIALIILGMMKWIIKKERTEEALQRTHDELELRVNERTAELRKSEERYRLMFENVPVGIAHFDIKSVVTDCNEYLAEILGAPREKNHRCQHAIHIHGRPPEDRA